MTSDAVLRFKVGEIYAAEYLHTDADTFDTSWREFEAIVTKRTAKTITIDSAGNIPAWVLGKLKVYEMGCRVDLALPFDSIEHTENGKIRIGANWQIEQKK